MSTMLSTLRSGYVDQITVRLCYCHCTIIMQCRLCYHMLCDMWAWHMNYYEWEILTLNKIWHIIITWLSYKKHQIVCWFNKTHHIARWSNKNHQLDWWSHKNHLCHIIRHIIIIIMTMGINIGHKSCRKVSTPDKRGNNCVKNVKWCIDE